MLNETRDIQVNNPGWYIKRNRKLGNVQTGNEEITSLANREIMLAQNFSLDSKRQKLHKINIGNGNKLKKISTNKKVNDLK